MNRALRMTAIDNREAGPPDFLVTFDYESLPPSQAPIENLTDVEQHRVASGLDPADCHIDSLLVARLRLRESDDSAYLPRLGQIEPQDAFLLGQALGWPDPVVHQVLFEHGNRLWMDEQYSHLHLSSLVWGIESHTATELAQATQDPTKTRVQTVEADPQKFIDHYSEVKGHMIWTTSWEPEPFFLDRSLLEDSASGLHLMEGHTRLGLLKGLLATGQVEADSLHRCWVARVI